MIPAYEGPLPTLTTAQMIEVDRAMIEDFGIGLIQMMENAGRCLAHLARERFLDADPRGKRVVVLAGTGGNGGGALVAARRLHNYGATVWVYATRADDRFGTVPQQQLNILRRVGVFIGQENDLAAAEPADLILDGLIGYRLRGAPRGTVAEMIGWANGQTAPTLALDVPSGVDTTTGQAFSPAIRATATMTLALPKTGLQVPRAAPMVGELYLADISVPPQLYARPPLAMEVGPVFARGDIVRLR